MIHVFEIPNRWKLGLLYMIGLIHLLNPKIDLYMM